MNQFPFHIRVSLKKVGFCTVTLKNKIATIGINHRDTHKCCLSVVLTGLFERV